MTYRGLLRKWLKDETLVTRILILVFLSLVAAIVLSNTGDSILTWTFMGAGLRGAVSLFPLMLTLFVRKTINRSYVLLSMFAAPICTILGKFLLPFDILPIFYGLMGSLLFIVIGLLQKETARN